MNKFAIAFTALVLVVLAALLLFLNIHSDAVPFSPGNEVKNSTAVDTERSDQRVVTLIPEASPQLPVPKTDPHEALLDTLYDSPVNADRLVAARQIAARNDERGMADLATFISAAEEQGDPSLVSLAGQVAEILAQMQGSELEALATELAYAPSALVAEAAVNAAVRSQQNQIPETLIPVQGIDPNDQKSLDDYAQNLQNEEAYP